MDAGRYTFVLDIPPISQRDVLAGRRPPIQLNIDATAMTQAGIGAGYIQQHHAQRGRGVPRPRTRGDEPPVELGVRVAFNPNLDEGLVRGVMQIINNITMLAIFLTGAALIREREHGTIEHLLVMPLKPFEIMLAKIWANGLVVLVAAACRCGSWSSRLLQCRSPARSRSSRGNRGSTCSR